MQIQLIVISHRRKSNPLDHRFQLGIHRRPGHAEQPQVFRSDPAVHVAVRQDEGARLDEHGIASRMIEMMVRVHDEPDGQLRPAPDFRQQLLRADSRRERINHHNAVIANHEAGVRPCGRIGPTDRRPDVRPDLGERER